MKIANPILVTGGTGFIGRKLIDLLLEDNHEVTSFALPGEPVPEHWQDRVNVIRGDLTNQDDVIQAMQGMNTVFHLAAVVGMGSYEQHRAITIEGSRNVYEAAVKNQTKVILAASIVVFGHQIQTEVCHEDLPHGRHQGPYSWAKMAQEKLAIDYQAQGMSLCVIRPANVYGVGSGPWVEGLFGMIERSALRVVGDGSGNAGLVHVNNLVKAFVLAAANEKAVGRIYTVCDGLDVTWSQYFHDLAKMKGIDKLPNVEREHLIEAAKPYDNPEKLEIASDMPTLPFEFINLIGYANRFDSTRVREELGWAPETTYAEALEEIRATVS